MFTISPWSGEGKALPNNLSKIGLIAAANASDKGYLAIEYSFTNEADCEQESKTKDDAGL